MLKIQKIGKCLLMPASKHINMFPGCQFYLIKDPCNYVGLIDYDTELGIEDIRCKNDKDLGVMLKSVDELVKQWNMKKVHYGWGLNNQYRKCFENEGYVITEHCLGYGHSWYEKEM